MTAFNERLRELRAASGLSQDGLARASGLSVSAVSKLEQHGAIDPSWSTVQRLAKGLGVSVLAFLDDEQPAPAPAPKKPRKGKAKK